ncbi:MAG TPA: hypothetical protein PLU33_09040 [Treponemataceae bacterium]|nr:hypothetical protein [Treponemataceae bacterium]
MSTSFIGIYFSLLLGKKTIVSDNVCLSQNLRKYCLVCTTKELPFSEAYNIPVNIINLFVLSYVANIESLITSMQTDIPLKEIGQEIIIKAEQEYNSFLLNL